MIKKIARRLSPPYLRFYSFLRRAKRIPRYKKTSVSFPGYQLEVADMLSFAWQYWEIILKECYAFKVSNNNPVIIDCGANIGLSALYFSKLYPGATIKAIEADETIAAICQANITTNKAANVEVIAKAAWTKNGFISFSSEGADGGHISDDKTAQVACIDFNEYLQQFPAIDFLKIDIEGAESEVIRHIAGQVKKIRHFFIEYHSSPSNPQQLGNILQILSDNGFRYYIEDLHKKNQPFIGSTGTDHFDLQLNIYARHTQF